MAMNAANLVYAPKVPYVSVIPNGMQPGKAIVFKGLVLADKPHKRFDVNLANGLLVDGDHRDDISLHISVRFGNENKIVFNTMINNVWGVEEPTPMVFSKGQNFELRILALSDYYKVAVNGKHLYDYRHRLPLVQVRTVYIVGGVTLDFVEFQGNAPTAPPIVASGGNGTQDNVNINMGPQANSYPPGGPPHAIQGPIVKPKVPFTHRLAGLRSGQQVFVTGTPKMNCDRFNINFYSGADIAFHFDVRFNTKPVEIVRNTFRKGRWDSEEKNAPNFPFELGGTFDMIFLSDNEGYKVAVNGTHFIQYIHRIDPDKIDSLSIEGDVSLQQVHVM